MVELLARANTRERHRITRGNRRLGEVSRLGCNAQGVLALYGVWVCIRS